MIAKMDQDDRDDPINSVGKIDQLLKAIHGIPLDPQENTFCYVEKYVGEHAAKRNYNMLLFHIYMMVAAYDMVIVLINIIRKYFKIKDVENIQWSSPKLLQKVKFHIPDCKRPKSLSYLLYNPPLHIYHYTLDYLKLRDQISTNIGGKIRLPMQNEEDVRDYYIRVITYCSDEVHLTYEEFCYNFKVTSHITKRPEKDTINQYKNSCNTKLSTLSEKQSSSLKEIVIEINDNEDDNQQEHINKKQKTDNGDIISAALGKYLCIIFPVIFMYSLLCMIYF
jgi:hypothetical protein